MLQTQVFKNRQGPGAAESTISTFILRDFGHFVAATDDRIFVNVFRRAVVTELGLPSNALTVVTGEEHIVRTVKEMCVKKKQVIVFIQTSINNKRLDDIIRQLAWKLHNCKVALVTTEAELPTLALLREQKIADSWIMKPVVIKELLVKVASIIKPHGNLDKLVQKAEEFLAQGSFRHVLAVCRKIFEVSPNSPVAYMLMGDAFRGLDMVDEMVSAYEHASYVDSLYLEPLQKLVDYFKAKNDKARVVQYLEKLDALSPLNTERKMEIACIQLEIGNDDDAKDTFESVMRLATKKVCDTASETASRIGTIYAKRNSPEAEAYLRKAIEVYGSHLDKSHMHLFNNLGILLRRGGKWRDAVVEYTKALSIDPDNAAILYNAALAYDDGLDIPHAQDCMRRALRVSPDFYRQDAVASYNIATIFSKAGDKDEALAFVKNSLAVNPEYACARELLAELQAPAR